MPRITKNSKGEILIKFLKPLDFISLFIFTLLFIYDFFPNIPLADAIPKGVLITGILGLLLFSFLFKKYKEPDHKEILKWQVFMTIYILSLMGILTLLGGRSSSGIAFDCGFLWVVLFIALFEMYGQWKKVILKDS